MSKEPLEVSRSAYGCLARKKAVLRPGSLAGRPGQVLENCVENVRGAVCHEHQPASARSPGIEDHAVAGPWKRGIACGTRKIRNLPPPPSPRKPIIQ